MAIAKRLFSARGAAFGSGAVRGGVGRSAEGLSAELFGEEKLFKVLSHMRQTAARRVMTAGAAAAAAELRRKAKAEIPSKHKDARKAVWSRRLKVKEARDGGAKVGGRVGKGSKVRARGPQAGRRGVGIGAQNIHWVFEGTGVYAGNDERRTGKRGGPVRRTGSSRPWVPPMWVMAVRNKSVLRSHWSKAGWKQMKKEVKKGKAFA